MSEFWPMVQLGRPLTNPEILWPPESPHKKAFLEVCNMGIDDHMP